MSLATVAIADGTNLVLGRGAIFFDRFVAGTMTKQGSIFLGNASKMEIAPSVETREKRGMVDNTNPLLARVEVSRTLEVNISLSEFKKDVLALALLGDVAEYTQAATPVVGETLTTSSVKGRTYWTAKRKLTAVAVKVSAVTKTEGTDYEIDTESGAVTIKESGTIANASTVTIDYTPTLISGGSGLTQVNLATAGTINGELKFLGNPMNGKIHEVILWKVQMLPDGVLGLIGEDFAEFGLKGTILSDATNHASDPFGRMYQR